MSPITSQVMYWGRWAWITCGLICLVVPVFIAIDTHRTNKNWVREFEKFTPAMREAALRHLRESKINLPPHSVWKASWPGWWAASFITGIVAGGALLVLFS